MSKYYIYKMEIEENDIYFGSYIGQHKIGKKEPLYDGYKGSGSKWRETILKNHIPVKKTIIRLCESIEESNYWENYYIEQAKLLGECLWNVIKGGGGHEYERIYTDNEIKNHKKKYMEEHKEYFKEILRQYYKNNKERLSEKNKKYYEQNKDHISKVKKEYFKQYKITHAEHETERHKKYNDEHKDKRNQYYTRQCCYDGKIMTFRALALRLRRKNISNPTEVAKQYLITEVNDYEICCGSC